MGNILKSKKQEILHLLKIFLVVLLVKGKGSRRLNLHLYTTIPRSSPFAFLPTLVTKHIYRRSNMTKSSESTRRRRRKPNNAAPSRAAEEVENEVQPLDEDDQEEIVQSLTEEAQEQMELIHSIFSRVCEAAIFLCLLVGMATPDVWCWIHVIGASVLHWGSIQVAATAKPGSDDRGTFQTYFPLLAVLAVAAVVVRPGGATAASKRSLSSEREDDLSHHLGLAISNIVTMGGAFYLKWDSRSTRKALEDLERSKYRYKSL